MSYEILNIESGYCGAFKITVRQKPNLADYILGAFFYKEKTKSYSGFIFWKDLENNKKCNRRINKILYKTLHQHLKNKASVG